MPNSSTANPVYQTLSEFYLSPFGVPSDNKHQNKYNQFRNLIKLHSYSILDDSYYIRIKVPSESQPGKTYDVVIQFLPTSKEVEAEPTLENYVIQFFSNSPSFIYKYAALYKLRGYMIDALQEKMDPKYANVLPENNNKDMKLECDKSLYFAVKFLYDQKAVYLLKKALHSQNKMSFKQFVSDIDSNKDSLARTVQDIEKQAIEEGKIDKKKIEKTIAKKLDIPKRLTGGMYVKSKITPNSKTTSTLSTSHHSSNHKKGAKGKITPSRSTSKKK